MNDKKLNLLLALAMLLMFVTAFLPLLHINEIYFQYVYTFGAFLAVVVRILQRMLHRKDKSLGLRVRRLMNIEFWSALCYLVSAYFLIAYPYRSDWLAFLMAGAVLQIYTSFMIPYQMKKDLAAGKSETSRRKRSKNPSTCR